MDELNVVELVIQLQTGREKWEGVSFWLAPRDGDNLGMFAREMWNHCLPSALGLIDLNRPFRVKLVAERYTMSGPLALKMRHHLNQVAGGCKPVIEWSPVTMTYFSLGGPADNG